VKTLNWQAVTVIVSAMALAAFLGSRGNTEALALVITNVVALFSKPLEITK
jgi:hypothetical protein